MYLITSLMNSYLYLKIMNININIRFILLYINNIIINSGILNLNSNFNNIYNYYTN